MSGRLPSYSAQTDSILQRIGCAAVISAYSTHPIAQRPIGEFFALVRVGIEDDTLRLHLNAANQPAGFEVLSPDGLAADQVFPFQDGRASSNPLARLSSDLTHLFNPAPADPYSTIGAAVMLLASSSYHRNCPTNSYIHLEIIPPLQLRQLKIYLDTQGHPVGMLGWAWLTAATERAMHETARSLQPDEWRAGDRLFFNDFIAPTGHLRMMVDDMKTRLFPRERATSLRRRDDGTVRQVCYWHGSEERTGMKRAGTA